MLALTNSRWIHFCIGTIVHLSYSKICSGSRWSSRESASDQLLLTPCRFRYWRTLSVASSGNVLRIRRLTFLMLPAESATRLTYNSVYPVNGLGSLRFLGFIEQNKWWLCWLQGLGRLWSSWLEQQWLTCGLLFSLSPLLPYGMICSAAFIKPGFNRCSGRPRPAVLPLSWLYLSRLHVRRGFSNMLRASPCASS